MLSEENRLKLQMTGVYKHKPDVKLRGTLYSQSLYHCCNWTFKPREHDDGSVYMIDTYWSSGGFYIELTHENFDEFEFIVDLNDIKLFTEVSNKLGGLCIKRHLSTCVRQFRSSRKIIHS